MRTIFTVLLASLFLSIHITAQHSKVSWGPEIESSQINTIVGVDDAHFYVLNMRGKVLSSKVKYKLLKIDKSTQKVKKEIVIGTTFTKNEFFVHAKFNTGIFEGLLVSKKKINRVKIDLSGKIQDSEEVESLEQKVFPIDKYEIPSYLIRDSPFFILKEDPSIRVIESEDGSKCVTEIIYTRKHSDEVIYTVYDTKESYKPIYTFDFTLDKKDMRERILDVEVNNDGRMAILLKQYFSRNEKEYKNKKPYYSFALLHMDLNGDITEVDLGTAKKFWIGASIAMDSKGNVMVASMTEEEPGDGANRVILMKYDSLGNQKLIKNQGLKGFKKGKGKLDYSYRASEIVRCNDNSYFLISKNDKVQEIISHNKTSQNIHNTPKILRDKHLSDSHYEKKRTVTYKDYYYETKDILLDGFDGEGNYLWSKKIYRNIEEENSCYYSDMPIVYDEKGIKFYMNADLNSVNSFDKKKGKHRTCPSKKNVVIEAILSPDGELNYIALSDPDKYAIGIETIKKIGNKTYFISMDKKLFKMKVGVMD